MSSCNQGLFSNDQERPKGGREERPWEQGCIAKTMTSNGKQFTITREMLTAVLRDQTWPDVVAGISARFSKFALVLFCY